MLDLPVNVEITVLIDRDRNGGMDQIAATQAIVDGRRQLMQGHPDHRTGDTLGKKFRRTENQERCKKTKGHDHAGWGGY